MAVSEFVVGPSGSMGGGHHHQCGEGNIITSVVRGTLSPVW